MNDHNRRQFLKLAAAGAASPLSLRSGATPGSNREPAFAPKSAAPLDEAVPTVEALRTVTMTHRFGDLFNPPGLTNQRGCAQAALDVTGVRSVSFPPFAQGELNTAALNATGELLTGVLYIDGEYFAAKKMPIDFVWQPDRIERRARLQDLELSSVMVVPFEQMAVIVSLAIENRGNTRRRTEIKLALNGGVTRSVQPWGMAYSPGEFDNRRTVDHTRGAVLFQSVHTSACAAQGSWPRADETLPAWLVYRFDLGPGERRAITFANIIGEDAAAALRSYDALIRDSQGAAQRTRDEWNAELKAAFTPGNDRFSGYLPRLVTRDEAVRRLYQMAAMSALFFKRATPHSVYGTTYVTLAPRYWQTTTFLWDISLSAMLLALLDPAVLRRMIETWMQLDVHKHFGTEYLTGSGVGPWYSVNDFAMCRMACEYLRWSGDRAWLDRAVGGRKVLDRLIDYATHWRALDVNGHGLADYGGVSNLLEAVSSYVHEVAGLNAANVYNLRFVAELLEARGETRKALDLRKEAASLSERVLELYVPGKGIWNCRQPDGSLVEVRHCYDFGTVLATIGDALGPQRRREMVRFFREELQSPAWMRALSTRDIDVTFSIRPDHQWTGAYAAWPALALSALFRAGAGDVAVEWMRGLGRTATQGPIAQAHFVESFAGPETGGGALKAPSDQPYINDWACVSGCAYLEPIVESLFGVRAGLFGQIEATPQFGPFDPQAELRGLRYQGREYTVSAAGLREA
jgi:hypothetical protein